MSQKFHALSQCPVIFFLFFLQHLRAWLLRTKRLLSCQESYWGPDVCTLVQYSRTDIWYHCSAMAVEWGCRAPPKTDYRGSRCKNWPVSSQWQTPCYLPDRCRGDRWYVLVQVFITAHNLGWVLEESCVQSDVYPQGTMAFGPAVLKPGWIVYY